ncbi:MAG: triphosphoribosyl-dephospho-CoA synthase [Thaumarchaeota archaeon]|nr:triphosphoribosyl-dephospho-CoA synthase [Candidatus Calditenuaceae archaeon]MDW8187092.1 triphosphoribosyl-dephospho-CoA synthase [Nitrososphaerota archaeon]
MKSEDRFHLIASCATSALLVELLATPKPGLVDRRRDLRELNAVRMQASASSLYRWFYRGAELGSRGLRPGVLGKLILNAVRSSLSAQSGGNAHLGAILLLMPLCMAAGASLGSEYDLREAKLRRSVRNVISSAGWSDTFNVFQAIRVTRPAGLGVVPYLDVTDDRTYVEVRRKRIKLLDALSSYKGRDSIADELIIGYPLTFDVCLTEMRRVLRANGDLNDAIVNGLLAVMAKRVDSHIVRRNGLHLGRYASHLAMRALREGGVLTERGRRLLQQMDNVFREKDIRPGSSADVVDAATFVLLLVDRVKP